MEQRLSGLRGTAKRWLPAELGRLSAHLSPSLTPAFDWTAALC